MRPITELLAELRPQKLADRIERQAQAALANFVLRNLRPRGSELLLQLARLEHLLQASPTGAWRPFPIDERKFWERVAVRRLKRIYGSNGPVTAERIIAEGTSGGMRGVLQKYVADHVRHVSRELMKSYVTRYLQALEPAEKQLVERHLRLHLNHTLPPGARLHPPGEASLPRLLAQYPEIIEELQKLPLS